MDSEFDTKSVFIVLYDREKEYQFWQGGGLSQAETLWHLEQYKSALLDGRIEELS